MRTKRLEAELSWRTVKPEQTQTIKDFLAPLRMGFLSPFRGIKINFAYVNDDAEGGEYAEELAQSLRKTLDGFGVEVNEPTSVSIYWRGPPPTGLFLQIHSRDDGTAKAAGLLQKALKNAGIEAPAEDKSTPEMTINFFVASKPRPVEAHK